MTHRPDSGALQVSDAPLYGVEHEFGFVPQFVATGAGTRHSTIREAIAALASVSLDHAALNVFLRSGLFLNGATPFREIRRPNPAAVIPRANPMPRARAIEAYIDVFSQAVRRRLEPHSALALSGGCDSRHILLELHRQQRMPDYVLTAMLSGRPDEVEVAAAVAKLVGAEHVVRVADPQHTIRDELWKNDACGFMSFEHGWFAGVGRERDPLPWWDGIAGDVLSAGLFLEEWNHALFKENRLDELAERLVQPGPVPFFRDQALFPREAAVAEIRAELEEHSAAPNPVGSFYFWNRTRVSIACSAFGMLRPRGQVTLAPYLDRGVWELLASQPAELYLDHSFHREAVSRAYPDFAATPYASSKVWTDPPRVRRTRAWHLLKFLAGAMTDLEVIGTALRTVRSMVDQRRAADVDWLLPLGVYCVEIRRAAAR